MKAASPELPELVVVEDEPKQAAHTSKSQPTVQRQRSLAFAPHTSQKNLFRLPELSGPSGCEWWLVSCASGVTACEKRQSAPNLQTPFESQCSHGGRSAAGTAGSAVGYTAGDYSVTTAGSPFSYTEAFLEGDATPTATTVTAGVTPTLPILGNTTTTAGGVAGSLAGTITSAGVVSLTAGGAGTSATGQYISEITIR